MQLCLAYRESCGTKALGIFFLCREIGLFAALPVAIPIQVSPIAWVAKPNRRSSSGACGGAVRIVSLSAAYGAQRCRGRTCASSAVAVIVTCLAVGMAAFRVRPAAVGGGLGRLDESSQQSGRCP